MKTSYYNTTHSTSPELGRFESQAKRQESWVLEKFSSYGTVRMSPSTIHKGAPKNWPLTSIRRAMTNLTNQGKLIKTDTQARGPYGRPEYLWTLPPAQGLLF